MAVSGCGAGVRGRGRTGGGFRLRDGTLRAVSAVCPHRGGPIADGTIDRSVVMCPLHQHSFELTTGCSTSGAGPLRTYTVSTDSRGNIVLQLP